MTEREEHRERLLDAALEEALGGKAPPDLSRKIQQALDARGSGGSRVQRTRLSLPGLALARGWAVGAAASALVAAGVWSLAGRREAPASVWLADRKPAGSKEWTCRDRPLALERAGRVSARLLSGRARILSPDRLELSEGELDVHVVPGSGPFEVATPAGTVAVKGTRFTVWVEHERHEKEESMDRSFWAGTGAGVVTTVAVVSGAVIFSGEGKAQRVEPGQVSRAKAGHPPSAPGTLSAELSTLKGTLNKAQAALKESQAREAQAQTRVKFAEAFLEQLGKDHNELQDKITAALKTRQEEVDQKQERIKLMMMRQKLEIGKPLSDEAAKHLGLDDAQRAHVDAELVREKEQMVELLTSFIAEDPVLHSVIAMQPVQNQKDPETLFGFLWGSYMGKEISKINDVAFADADILSGKKTVYLEDILGKDAFCPRALENLERIRKGTLENAGRSLNEDQRSKLNDLLAGYYHAGSFNFGLASNIRIYREEGR